MKNLISFHIFLMLVRHINSQGKKSASSRKLPHWLIIVISLVGFIFVASSIMTLVLVLIKRKLVRNPLNLIQRQVDHLRMKPIIFPPDDIKTIETVGRPSRFTEKSNDENELKTII